MSTCDHLDPEEEFRRLMASAFTPRIPVGDGAIAPRVKFGDTVTINFPATLTVRDVAGPRVEVLVEGIDSAGNSVCDGVWLPAWMIEVPGA